MALKICPWWLSGFLNNSLRRLFQNQFKILNGLVNTGQTVADIGCGPGFFTLPLAKLVGDTGRVIAADLQPEMLERVKSRAGKKGLLSQIHLHKCGKNEIGIKEKVDFALVFYMVHEVPDPERFLREIADMLKPGGVLLLAEPKIHVSRKRFIETVDLVCSVGLKAESEKKVSGSRAVIFSKE